MPLTEMGGDGDSNRETERFGRLVSLFDNHRGYRHVYRSGCRGATGTAQEANVNNPYML